MKAIFRWIIVISFLAISATGMAQTAANPASGKIEETALQRLETEIGRAEKISGGIVGVSAVHLESGRRVGFHSKGRFPMASTYKVPIAVQFLTRVDRGEVSLDQRVEITARDLHPGSGILTALLNQPGLILSARNLLELTLIVSDNSAADLILRLSGGPEAVTARMRAAGIADMNISRPTVLLIADSEGYPLPPENEWTPEHFKGLSEGTTSESRKDAARKFETDDRDTSTPEAMIHLLEKIHRGEFLTKESNDLLLDILGRCRTGKSRIIGLLFPETAVAHKTGTLGATTSDAGIIRLPGDAGNVAIAIFVKASEKETQDREKAIAHIARSVYDYFLFQPAGFPLQK